MVSANLQDGKASVTVSIKNLTDEKMTFFVGAAKWAIKEAVAVNIEAGAAQEVTVEGYYDAAKVAAGTKGLAVTVTDINNSTTKTLKITENTAEQSGALGEEILVAGDKGDAFKDKVSAYEYMYAITFINKDSYSKTATVSVDDVKDWTVTIMNEDGSLVYAPGEKFTVYGYQTTVLYVKVMPNDGLGDAAKIPSIVGTATIGDSTQALKLSPETVNLSTDSMNADGSGIHNEKSGIPSGIWFLVAVIVLLVIATFWLASKRGVFSRKN